MGTKVKTCVVVGASPTTDSAFIKPILKQADYIIVQMVVGIMYIVRE